MYKTIPKHNIIESINQSIIDTEYLTHKNSSVNEISSIFSNQIEKNFESLNFFHKESPIFLNDVNLKPVEQNKKVNNHTKSIIGGSLWFLGQPIIKKRFVTPGATARTSIASKYLSQLLPQKIPSKLLGATLPKRILGTNVVGRVLGRTVPYVGGALIAIDVIELIIAEIESKNEKNYSGFRNGFGGGGFSGGGAGSSW